MDGHPEGTARRRRRRATSPAGAPKAVQPPEPPPAAPPTPATPATPKHPAAKPRRKATSRESAHERTLRDLVGGGRSQVGVSGALRARDVNRPTPKDLAEAEREVVIVRRNWKPPTG